MTPEELPTILTTLFGEAVQTLTPGSYQVETADFRLLVLLSDDQSWLRVLLPIAPAQDAQPYLEELMEANFDSTQEARYAVHQDVLWAVYQHSYQSLATTDFADAVQRLLSLREQGLNEGFNAFVEKRIRQIIQVAKQQGQSLELTMQTLDRFYQEGLMGEMNMGSQSREEVLEAWRRQLTRLWSENES